MTFEEIVKKYNAVEIPLTEEEKEIYVVEINHYRFEVPYYQLNTLRKELADEFGLVPCNIEAKPKAFETEEGQMEYRERWNEIMRQRYNPNKPKKHWYNIRLFD